VVDLLLHSGRSLEIVTEAATVTSHAALREDYDRSAAASVVADLLDKISVEGQPEERLFGLASATLDVMDVAPVETLPAVVVGFLGKAMAMNGCRPQLDACATCGAPLGEGALFSCQAGGGVCASCAGQESSVVKFTPEGRAWLQRLMSARMAEIPELGMESAAVLDCFWLMRTFVAYHLPAKLRALDFYAAQLVDS